MIRPNRCCRAAWTDPPLTPTGIHTTFDMAIDATGEVVGSASISATFTLTGSQRFHRVFQNGVQKGIFNGLNVVGTLIVTSGDTTYRFDLAGCVASTMSRMDQIHDPNGPKAGGAVPANDTSTGALPVALGSRLQMDTRGASPEPETPCLVSDGDEVFEFGWGRTVWFSFEGTGGPITVDPGGSNFDTVVAVYSRTGRLVGRSHRAGSPDGLHEIELHWQYAANAQNAGCTSEELTSVPRTVDGLVGWIRTLPSLDAGAPSEITIHGLHGRWLDVGLSPSWKTSCPGETQPIASASSPRPVTPATPLRSSGVRASGSSSWTWALATS